MLRNQEITHLSNKLPIIVKSHFENPWRDYPMIIALSIKLSRKLNFFVISNEYTRLAENNHSTIIALQ